MDNPGHVTAAPIVALSAKDLEIENFAIDSIGTIGGGWIPTFILRTNAEQSKIIIDDLKNEHNINEYENDFTNVGGIQHGKANETNEKKNQNNTVSSLSRPFSDALQQAVEMIEKLLSLKPDV